jgi:hypothetical protein
MIERLIGGRATTWLCYQARMGTLFSRWESLLIALALIVPESLRSCAKLEPYPAVILPTGAGTIRIKNGTVSAQRTFLTAKRNGKWEEVDVGKFLAPVAVHYFSGIARRDFGLRKSKTATPLQLERATETKRWMKARLAAQGFEPKQLRLMRQSMRITLASGKHSHSKTRRRKTYDLD